MRLISNLTLCSLIIVSLAAAAHPQAAKSELTTKARFLICKLNNWNSCAKMVLENLHEHYTNSILDHDSELPFGSTTKQWCARVTV